METLRLKRHQNIWTKWKKGRKREDHVKETPSEENWSHIVVFLFQIWCSFNVETVHSKVVIWWKVAIGITIAEIIAEILGYHEWRTKCKHWLKNCNRVCQAEKTILRTKCQSKSSCAEFDPIRDEREKHQGQNINMGKAPWYQWKRFWPSHDFYSEISPDVLFQQFLEQTINTFWAERKSNIITKAGHNWKYNSQL